MRIENHTDLDTSEIKARFKEVAFGIKTSNVLVDIHDTSKDRTTGYAQTHPMRYVKFNTKHGYYTEKRIQRIRIGVPRANPVISWRKLERRQKYKKFELSRINALTLTFAHELYHIVQYRERRPLSQIEADQFAVSIGQRMAIIGGD